MPASVRTTACRPTMVAVRVTGPMKVAVVGRARLFCAPAPPRTPDDLARHNCVQYRRVGRRRVRHGPSSATANRGASRWTGRVMVKTPILAVRAAVDGLGIAYTIEALAEPFLRSGQLVRVLEDWSPSLEGLFLYYSGRPAGPGHVTRLIDMIRAARSTAPPKSSFQNPFAEDLSACALASARRGPQILCWRSRSVSELLRCAVVRSAKYGNGLD